MSEGSLSISPADWQATLRVLTQIDSDPALAPDLSLLEPLISRLAKAARKRRRAAHEPEEEEINRRAIQSRQDIQANKSHDVKLVSATANVRIHRGAADAKQSGFAEGELRGKDRACYICHTSFRQLHSHYDRLCPPCADYNLERRNQACALDGRIALVTGGRVKIGHATALRLLRNGAEVHVTSRFPRDAAARFAAQADVAEWQSRLHIHGLDLMDIPSVLAFADRLTASLPHLDILINNAAQTVRRSPEFYAEPLALEHRPSHLLPAIERQLLAEPDTAFSILPEASIVMPSAKDRHGQPLEERNDNSWTLRLADLGATELLEVLLVNTAAPAMLCQRLLPLMKRSPQSARFIVNATGPDGIFAVDSKSARHPHVNVSKAGLNMLTRTAASDLAQDAVFMNSVDTGWISHEGGKRSREKLESQGWVPPLDEHDAAARLCAPIFDSVHAPAEPPVHGRLFRHFQVAQW